MSRSKEKSEERRKIDWEELPLVWIVIGFCILVGGIKGIIRSTQPELPVQKEHAVVIFIDEDIPFDKYKVKFINDKTVDMRDLDDGVEIGDTVYIEK